MKAASIRSALPKVTVWAGGTIRDAVTLDSDVFSFQVQTGLGNVGNFTVEVAPREDPTGTARSMAERAAYLWRVLKPNNVISIGFEQPGGLMLGLIGERTQEYQAGSAGMRTTFRIAGEGVGRLLQQDQVVLAALNVPETVAFIEKIEAALGTDHPLVAYVRGVWGPERGKGDETSYTFKGATVADVAKWVLTKTPSTRIPVLAEAFGGSGEAGDIFDREVTTWNDGRIWSDSLCEAQGTVWSLLNQILDPDFYELILDYRPPEALSSEVLTSSSARIGRPVLRIRPKPFTEQALARAPLPDRAPTDEGWENLTTWLEGLESHEIGLDEVLASSFGSTDADAFSMYVVNSDHALIGNSQAQAEGLSYPLVDTWAAQNWGLRAYSARLNLLSADIAEKAAGETDYTGAVWEDIRTYRNILFQWYWMNPLFVQGSVTIPGRDLIRPGDPIRLVWADPPTRQLTELGFRAYCTGLVSSWSRGSLFKQTLNFTRGHNAALVQEALADVARTAPASNPSHYAET